jgi:MarR-like DNA-binding transcriptional regulator SgrR of sgrS sRNA
VVLTLILLAAIAKYAGILNMSHGSLNVIFPISRLKPEVALLDPENTESVWEYYLLENISCGLVRDSRDSSLGYEGCLAERFYQEDPRTWVFYLRDLKWSDGSEVTSNEIENWFNNLRFKPHRHIRFLPLVENFEFDPKTRKLVLFFLRPMDHSVLHELSLADTGFFPSDYKKTGWSKTVGPYFVKTWDIANGLLVLSSNKFSPLFRKAMPETVLLQNVTSFEGNEKLFKQLNIDIVPSTAFMDSALLKIYKNNSAQEFQSHPSSILFWYFNFRNAETQSVDVRKRIAQILEKFRAEIRSIFPEDLKIGPETQMIPDGFNGRLDRLEANLFGSHDGRIISKVRVRIPTPLKNFPQLGQKLTEVFKRDGILLEVFYDDSPDLLTEDSARIYLFVGNQLDSSGSWSFLMGPPLGPLNPWMPNFKSEFDAVFSASDWLNRLSASKELHKKLLNDAYAIPLFVGGHRYFFSKRVDASRWNSFDSRLRFYELSYQ